MVISHMKTQSRDVPIENNYYQLELAHPDGTGRRNFGSGPWAVGNARSDRFHFLLNEVVCGMLW